MSIGERGMAPEQRFEKYHCPEPNTGCWLWFGTHHPRGYGHLALGSDRAYALAHRWSYERFVGPIPEGLVIDHLCKQPACVNPAHLEAVTQKENTRRSDACSTLNAKKAHCPQGHPYEGANLLIDNLGHRRCLECTRTKGRENMRRYRARARVSCG